MRRSILLSFGLFVLQLSQGFACDLHSSPQPPLMLCEHSEGKFQLGVNYQYTNQESNIRPEGLSNAPGQYLDSHISYIHGTYQISDTFGLQLNLPLIYRDYQRVIDGQKDEGSESGLGDISLLANFVPYQHKAESKLKVEVTTGVKFPTGDTDPLEEERREAEQLGLRHGSLGETDSLIFGDDLALGSGSYDFLFGGQLYYAVDNFLFTASSQYVLKQEGDYSFEFGDSFFFDIGPGLIFSTEENVEYALRLSFSGETKDDDEIVGRTIRDSSETTLYLGPEFILNVSNSWDIRLAADFPIERDSSADQVVPHHRLRAGASYLF